MTDYPRMLYRKGGSDSPELHGFRCETRTVDDAEEEQAAGSEGWRRSPAEAHGQTKARAAAPDTPETKGLQDERDGLLAEVEQLRAEIKKLDTAMADSAKDGLKEREAAANELNSLREQLAAAIKERDESRELIAAFDRDNDGKPGGSKTKTAETGKPKEG